MINKEDLEKLMEDQKEEARIEDLEYQEECKQERENDNSAWDMRDGDYC